MKIAVIGSGISGLSCAYRLAQGGHDVSLLESASYFGGHSNTVDVTLEGHTHGVDTGFLVFNHKTYPGLVKLFAELQVETVATDMTFSVKMPLSGPFGQRVLEWAGANLDTVFSQRSNLFRPAFLRMLRDALRFNREATALASSDTGMTVSLGSFLVDNQYSAQFRDWYLLPMAGCIWSCPTAQMLEFPLASFVRFCHNHGLLQVNDRPQWQTVKGGSRKYVEKMLAVIPHKQLGVNIKSVTRPTIGGKPMVNIETDNGIRHFDHVVMACHSDQTLRLLWDASRDERELLSAIRYQPNRAVLHTDASCLPENPKAWSAWNYQSRPGAQSEVCVHYLINKLQPLPFRTPVIVSLNPIDAPYPASVISSFDYAHPVFDASAVAAQSRLASIQGMRNTWFAGAWTGYGFHEDGLKSGLAAAQALSRLARNGQLAAA